MDYPRGQAINIDQRQRVSFLLLLLRRPMKMRTIGRRGACDAANKKAVSQSL